MFIFGELFMTYLLLRKHRLPPFKKIQLKEIEPTIDAILLKNRKQLARLCKVKDVSWKTVAEPIIKMDEKLNQVWALVTHLHSVKDSKMLRKIYNRCLPKIVTYSLEISHNETLYHMIQDLERSKSFARLNHEQQRVIHHWLRDFKLAGVTLSTKDKERFTALENKLQKLSTQFGENVLDATQAWTLSIENPDHLKELPEPIFQQTQHQAKLRKQKGCVLTLDFPIYYAVMTYVSDRSIREKMYHAYTTRASDQTQSSKKYDNTGIMNEVLNVRRQMAQLVGFENYDEYSLATKMADKPQTVFHFLESLLKKAKPAAIKELEQLKEFAKKQFGCNEIKAWDTAYFSEAYQKAHFDFSQEELRPYFPIDHVLKGLFGLVNQLFGIVVVEKKNAQTWHASVRYFEIQDTNKKLIGSFYTDMYARKNKRSGAWMDDYRTHCRLPNGQIQTPIAFLVCNFNASVNKQPALLTHDEVVTLFHEFGHCLHHLLSKVEVPDLSGTNGVEWDAVEFPSQFLENFCWEKAVIQQISSHHKTKLPLPEELLNRLIKAKNFHAGMFLLRQIEFGLLDFKIHFQETPNIQKILNTIRKDTALIPAPPYNRFQHTFSHIFQGGYAAGYYSYLWAEVLSCDAFQSFQEHGVINHQIGERFRKTILEKGGAEDAMELFKTFRGRPPKIEALLQHYGLTSDQ